MRDIFDDMVKEGIFDDMPDFVTFSELYNVTKRSISAAVAIKTCDMCASDVHGSTHSILYGDSVTLCSARCLHRLSRVWKPTKKRVLAYRACKRTLRGLTPTQRIAMSLWAIGAASWTTTAYIWLFA